MMRPGDAATPLLEARGLVKAFAGVTALSDGRITVRAGSVHALCGGNGAGKSTLVGILSGLLTADAGEVLRDGKIVHHDSPAAAAAAGVAIITQELNLVRGMTVAENIRLGREFRWGKWLVDRRRMDTACEDLLERLGFPLQPRQLVRDLPLAHAQLVEIAKAISRDARILIMDEPTSALGHAECERLFAAIEALKAQGVGIIYISHRLGELFDVADSYTVMRNGGFVESGAIADIDRETLVTRIVGRELDAHVSPTAASARQPLLKTTGLSRMGAYEGIEMTAGAGEIVGLYGLVGSGRSAFAAALAGIEPAQTGTISLAGTPVMPDTPRAALRLGIAMVPEDRKLSGLILSSSIRDNLILGIMPALARLGLLRHRKTRFAAIDLAKLFAVKMHADSAPVNQLSGGNQQKVLMARYLAMKPRLLICDEPTRGVDEESRRQIHGFLHRHAEACNAVLMISSEADELVANCHRIYVFKNGKSVACVDARQADATGLARLAT